MSGQIGRELAGVEEWPFTTELNLGLVKGAGTVNSMPKSTIWNIQMRGTGSCGRPVVEKFEPKKPGANGK